MKCSRKGTFQRLCRWEMPRSGMIVAVATRISAAGGRKARGACRPDRACFPCNGKFPKGNEFILFASAKRTKKQPGLRPATSVQNSIDYVFSCCFRLSSLHRHVVRPTFSDFLNRCEREIVVQTQDHAFRKWEVVQQAHRGMSHSKRVAARYLCCGENLFLRCAD